MGDVRTQFRVLGETIELPGSAFGGAREMYCKKVYFAEQPVTLRPTDVVVDLGANQGLFTLLAALKCRRVVAVEAQQGFAREIARNLRAHHVQDRVAIEIALVGSGAGLFSDPEALRAASHFDRELPPTMTMPELMRAHQLDSIDFLKIDIEGSEFSLLRDAGSWLSRVDRLAMEVHAAYGSPVQLCRELSRAGYTVRYRSSALEPSPPTDRDGYIYAYRAS